MTDRGTKTRHSTGPNLVISRNSIDTAVMKSFEPHANGVIASGYTFDTPLSDPQGRKSFAVGVNPRRRHAQLK